MNFKPTLWKTVVSLISGILANYIFVSYSFLLLEPMLMCDCIVGEICSCPQPGWMSYAFYTTPIIVSLIVMAIVYLIWSVLQKK